MLSYLRRLFRRQAPPDNPFVAEIARQTVVTQVAVDDMIRHLARAQVEIEALRRRVDNLERRGGAGGGQAVHR